MCEITQIHTDEWDNTFKELAEKLDREPTPREVQEQLYHKHFGEQE